MDRSANDGWKCAGQCRGHFQIGEIETPVTTTGAADPERRWEIDTSSRLATTRRVPWRIAENMILIMIYRSKWYLEMVIKPSRDNPALHAETKTFYTHTPTIHANHPAINQSKMKEDRV